MRRHTASAAASGAGAVPGSAVTWAMVPTRAPARNDACNAAGTSSDPRGRSPLSKRAASSSPSLARSVEVQPGLPSGPSMRPYGGEAEPHMRD